MSKNYQLSLKNYNGYGKIRLSSAPRHVYSYPGMGNAYKLYHLYVEQPKSLTEAPSVLMVHPAVHQEDFKEMKGEGQQKDSKKEAEETTASVTNETIEDMLKFPVKISEEDFKKKRSVNYAKQKGGKKMKLDLESQFDFN
jgi:hypothetical protein